MAVELKTMEIKKTQQLISEVSKDVKEFPNTSRETNGRKLRDFLADVKGELSKISWTTPDELRTYTKIVIGATFCFGMGVYLTDLMIQFVLGSLESTIRLFGG